MGEGLGSKIPPPPRPPEPERRWWSGASWPAAAGALAFGLAVDLLLRGPAGAGVLALSVAASTASTAVRRPRRDALWFYLAAPILAGFAAIRASQTLVAMDIATSIGLFALGAAFARGGEPVATGFRGYVARSLAVLRSVPEGLATPIAPFARAAVGETRVRRLSRTLAIVTPVVALFLVLLGSADAVFAHYLRTSLAAVPTTRGLPAHIALIAAGAVALATLLARSATPVSLASAGTSRHPRIALRRGEWTLLLGAVDAVFAAFVLVQVAYFFGGRTLVLHEEGLTFARYARTGFAQLLIAGILTTGLIAMAWRFGRRDAAGDGTRFSLLSGLLVLLTLVVLASAFRRLVLYEEAFGWTWPRLLGHATVVFLAVSLCCALIWILRRRGEWLATAVLVTGLVTLLGLNVLDPDRFIAQRNIARFTAIGALDTRELFGLSPDAAAAIVTALPELPAADRAPLRHHLACQRDDLAAEGTGIGSWNLARSRALRVLDDASLGIC